MTRKHPNARRVALVLFASFLFAASACAMLHPDPAQAETTTVTTPGKRPLPGDPNIPDEGGRITLTTTTSVPKQQAWVVYWLKDAVHFVFRVR